jgi:hypothetical protein
VRRRRKSEEPVHEDADSVGPGGPVGDAGDTGAEPRVDGFPQTGPYDAEDLPADGVERVDLGSLLVAPENGRELRLQVDESTGVVQSVVLAPRSRRRSRLAAAPPPSATVAGGPSWSAACRSAPPTARPAPRSRA